MEKIKIKYGPLRAGWPVDQKRPWGKPAHPERLEPPTLGSEDRCSIQLSYGRTVLIFFLVGMLRAGALRLGFRLRRWGRLYADRMTVKEAVITSRPGDAFKAAKIDPALRVLFNPRMAAFVPFAEFPMLAALGPYGVCWRVFFGVHDRAGIARLRLRVKTGGAGIVKALVLLLLGLSAPFLDLLSARHARHRRVPPWGHSANANT